MLTLTRLLERCRIRKRAQTFADLSDLSEIVAGENGVRLCVLTKDGLASALKNMGGASVQSLAKEQAMDYTRKLLLVKKVPIFRHLSTELHS